MSIALARRFIQRALVDEAFVVALNDASTRAEMQGMLTREGFDFTYGHFDEAYHNLLTQCQDAGQADLLRQIKIWWDLLTEHYSQENEADKR